LIVIIWVLFLIIFLFLLVFKKYDLAEFLDQELRVSSELARFVNIKALKLPEI